MKNEKQLLENFQVEELEKRYEMGWLPSEPDTFHDATQDPQFIRWTEQGIDTNGLESVGLQEH